MNNERITRKRTSKGHCTLAAEGKPQTLQDGLRGHHTPAQSRQGGATPPGRPGPRSVYVVSSSSVWFGSSVPQPCPTLCNPMDCRTPGFPVHHQLPELAQTHVHQVGDAMQPSHPLCPLLLSLRIISPERQIDTLPSWADVCMHACSVASVKSDSLQPCGL